MHRTITSATLLVTSAAVGLTGCVSVTPPARPGAEGGPQIVQAPAREALERLLHSRSAAARADHPTRVQPDPRRLPAPRSGAPRVALPRLPALPQPPPAVVQPAQPPRMAPREREACALRRDFAPWQSGGHHMSLC